MPDVLFGRQAQALTRLTRQSSEFFEYKVLRKFEENMAGVELEGGDETTSCISCVTDPAFDRYGYKIYLEWMNRIQSRVTLEQVHFKNWVGRQKLMLMDEDKDIRKQKESVVAAAGSLTQ